MRPDGSHQALVRRGNVLHLEEVPTESPNARGLLIALSYVGVCGTDLQILNGSRPDTADILGHEGIGVVVQAGRKASLQVGENVVFNPVAQLSENRVLGHNVRGLFQQYIAVNSQEVDDGLVLPAESCIPPVCGALVEPLGAVIYAHELISRKVPELRAVVIFGAGPIGLLTAAYLHELGVNVLLVHPNQARLNTAIALKLVNAASAIACSGNLSERILAHNDGNRLDAAVICTTRVGAPVALRHAVEVVKSGGCIDLITNYPELADAPNGIATDTVRAVRAANVCGLPKDGSYVSIEMSGHRIVFTGHRGTSRYHLTCATHVLRSRGSTYAKLITHVLSLRNAAGAIQTLAGSRERSLYGYDCIKAVIDLHADTNGVTACALK